MLHFVDFDQASTSGKSAHKKHGDGFEAPRNSMELTLEALRDYSVLREDIPYSCNLRSCYHPKPSSNHGDGRVKKIGTRLMAMDDSIPVGIQLSGEANCWRDARGVSFVLGRDSPDLGAGRKERRRPVAREHPQEELLQKFKKDFQAWQAAKAWEQSRSIDMDDHEEWKSLQISPLESRPRARKLSELKKSLSFPENRIALVNAGDRDAARSPLPASEINGDVVQKALSPTRIVILKPCPEFIDAMEDTSPVCSPELIKKENNMEAFLEEVKRRLKSELEGGRSVARWPASDMPKRIARDHADEVTLVRSASMRSYRSEQRLDIETPERFIGRDARKLLSERLKSALKRETDAEMPPSHRRGSSASSEDDMKRGSVRRCAKKGKSLAEEDARWFLHGRGYSGEADTDTASPRSLSRSLSAPVSMFAKLLSDEPHVMTGALIQRKHKAASRSKPPEETKSKKSPPPSSLRVRLPSLRHRLFGKKLRSAADAYRDEFRPMPEYAPAPSVLSNAGIMQENFTEVPPSPASACSPPYEMCRGGYPSPVSPLDARFAEDHSSQSSVHEPSRLQFEQVNAGELEAAKAEINPSPADADDVTEGPAKAYVKRVLVTAGLYRDPPPSDATSAIPEWVFQTIEDAAAGEAGADCAGVGRRLLFDLVNEALASVVQPATTTMVPSVKQWWCHVINRLPHGQRLLNEVWRRMQAAAARECGDEGVAPQPSYIASWTSAELVEEMEEMAREVETEVADEMVDEMVWDVLLNVGE